MAYRKSSKIEVPQNEQEKIEHKENKQGQSQEQWAQETLVEQGHKNEQQRKTYDIDICSFPEDDEILVKKAEWKDTMKRKRDC